VALNLDVGIAILEKVGHGVDLQSPDVAATQPVTDEIVAQESVGINERQMSDRVARQGLSDHASDTAQSDDDDRGSPEIVDWPRVGKIGERGRVGDDFEGTRGGSIF